MTSLSHLSYGERATRHTQPVARKVLQIAETKKTNLVISADLTTSEELLKCADELGPYIAVFKTHIDIISDLSPATLTRLKTLATNHNFLIFEDRKFIDIGHTVQRQYHGGPLLISSFADIANLSILSGDGIVTALAQTIAAPDFPHRDARAFLILAEMTSKGSLATGAYTARSIDLARAHPEAVMGFVATRGLGGVATATEKGVGEDFVVFTTGVNMRSKGDQLGQQYQTPAEAVAGGADFVIAGRGIYEAEEPVKAARAYREEGWEAYLRRIGG